MNRRGLFRLAFWSGVAATVTRPFKAIVRKLWSVRVGRGGDVATLNEALAMVKPGGFIYVLPGRHEVTATFDVPPGLTIMGHREDRPVLTWTKVEPGEPWASEPPVLDEEAG